MLTVFLDIHEVVEEVAVEDVRKLYVALTRAKSHLLVSYHRDNGLSRALRAKSSGAVLEQGSGGAPNG